MGKRKKFASMGAISVAVFENPKAKKKGEVWYCTSVQRKWPNKQTGKWEVEEINLSPLNLTKLIAMLNDVHNYVMVKQYGKKPNKDQK